MGRHSGVQFLCRPSLCATSAADTKQQTKLTRGESLRCTHCSSSRRSCRRSRSGCHTSSGPECSCYSRSGIHEVRRSFHLFSSGANKQTVRWKWLQRAWILTRRQELSDFSTRNHRFLGVSLSNSDSEFKTVSTPEAKAPSDEIPDCAINLPEKISSKSSVARLNFFCGKKKEASKEKFHDKNESLAAVLDFWLVLNLTDISNSCQY